LAQITNIKQQQDLILAEFNELLQQASDVLGLDCKVYRLDVKSGNEADLRITLQLMSGESGKTIPVTKYEFQWDQKCNKHGLTPSCLHKVYELKISRVGRTANYEVMGIWSMRKQRCPVIVKDIITGKLWKVPTSYIVSSKEVKI